MQKIGNVMSSAFAGKSVFRKQVHASMVTVFCNELILGLWGKFGREQAKALHFKKNIITISAANSLIAQELKFKNNQLLRDLNKKFGPDMVKRIKIIQKGIDKSDDLI
jgi:hypothetical protein